jgi:hypothetical protein
MCLTKILHIKRERGRENCEVGMHIGPSGEIKENLRKEENARRKRKREG